MKIKYNLLFWIHIPVFCETTYEMRIDQIKNCSHARSVADIVTVVINVTIRLSHS